MLPSERVDCSSCPVRGITTSLSAPPPITGVGSGRRSGGDRHRLGCTKSRVNGTFTDSLSAYRHDSVALEEMGLVRVGEVRGTRENRRANMESLNMWKGSLTRITSRP